MHMSPYLPLLLISKTKNHQGQNAKIDLFPHTNISKYLHQKTPTRDSDISNNNNNRIINDRRQGVHGRGVESGEHLPSFLASRANFGS